MDDNNTARLALRLLFERSFLSVTEKVSHCQPWKHKIPTLSKLAPSNRHVFARFILFISICFNWFIKFIERKISHLIMSQCDKSNQIVLTFTTNNKNWNDSTESIQKQKITKLTKSERSLEMDSMNLLLFKSEALKWDKGETSRKDHSPIERMMVKQKEIQDKTVLHVPPKHLNGDLTVLRVTLTPPESIIHMLDSQIVGPEKSKTPSADLDIFEIIDGSENAPKDRVPWKYLKRSRLYNREKKKFMVTWLRTVHYHCSQVLSRRRMNLTCLNCTLNVKTNIRHVNTIRTRRNACLLTVFGLCGLPYILFLFKDVVHICPSCKIYLGFCPAFKYPQKADVMTDVLTPISLTSIYKFREKVTSSYNDTVSKVKEKGRRISLTM